MKLSLIITAAVVLIGFTACKRGTDPAALQGLPAADQTTNLPADVTFAADDTTGVKTDSAATSVAQSEAVIKEQLAAQQESAVAKTTAPPASAGKAKKKVVSTKRPTDSAPVQYSSKNHPSSWSKSQIKWAGIVEQHRALQVGDAASRMSNQGTETYNGVYALYAVHRYLYLGNYDEALVQWAKFNAARNGPQSKLLNDLFEVSKSVDDTFAKFVAAQNAVPKKKKKR